MEGTRLVSLCYTSARAVHVIGCLESSLLAVNGATFALTKIAAHRRRSGHGRNMMPNSRQREGNLCTKYSLALRINNGALHVAVLAHSPPVPARMDQACGDDMACAFAALRRAVFGLKEKGVVVRHSMCRARLPDLTCYPCDC